MFALVCCVLALGMPAVMALDFDTCPSPPVMNNFDISKYLGTWYEIERNYNPAESSKHRCGTTHISQLDSNDYNVMFNTTWKYRDTTRRQVIKGKYNANDEPAKLKIKPIPLFPKQNYWVLDTDYDNYAIVWSCAEFYFSHYELVWIFGRNKNMRPETRMRAYNKLQQYGFKLEDLIVVEHSHC